MLGRGSVLNSIGEVEMDAVIMEGHSLSTGAVACVQNIANPVKLARLVMEKVRNVRGLISIAIKMLNFN